MSTSFSFVIFSCLLCAFSVHAFVEDIWLPDTEPPLATTTTEKPAPVPTLPPNTECDYLCRHVSSCKDILANYPPESTVCNKKVDSEYGHHSGKSYNQHFFNWHCFDDWHCQARFGCPSGHIRSGFGTTVELQRRCLPIHTCQYFAHMYAHLNEVHEEVFQLC